MVRLLAILLLLLSAATAHTQSIGMKYWFAAGGSDANPCTSISGTNDPGRYRTWKGTWSCMHAGDTFHMKAGTYNELMHESVITVPNGISAVSPTIIEGEGATGCAVAENCNTIIDTDGHDFPFAQYLTFRNFKITGQNHNTGNSCMRFTSSGPVNSGVVMDNVELGFCGQHGIFTTTDFNNLTVRNFSIHDTNQNACEICGHGGYLEGTDTLIENGVVHDITLGINVVGFQIYDSTNGGTTNRAIVRNVDFRNITKGDALIVAGPSGTFYNNTFTNTLRGLTLWGGSSTCYTGHRVYNNTFYKNTIGIQMGTFAAGSCTGKTVELSNNIIVGNGQNIDLQGGWTSSGTNNLSNSTSSSNCVVLCGSAGVTVSAITDVTTSTTNFHLKTGTNSAVDAGVTLTIVTTDKDGIKRPQGSGADIGAYERSGSGTTQLAPPANLRVS